MSYVIFKKTKNQKINKTTTMGISASGKSRNNENLSKKLVSSKKNRNGL